LYPAAFLSFGAVLAIAVESALARIQIDRGHLRPLVCKRDRDMHSGGGFSGAALFIGENYSIGAGHGGLSDCAEGD